MFITIWNKIEKFFNPYYDFKEEESLKRFRDYLESQSVIRIYVPNSPNYGHQGQTIGLLRQLTNPLNENGFAYEGHIQVYFDGGIDNKKKILNLLPELKGKNSGNVGDSTVKLISLYSKKPGYICELGFSGGSDDGLPNIAVKVQTEYFLRLQPYMWYSGKNEIQFLDKKRKTIILTKQKVLGGDSFAQRVYYSHPVKVTKSDWNFYKIESEEKTNIVEFLSKQENPYTKQFDFSVVYGTQNLSLPAEERMFLIILALLASQRKQTKIDPEAKPIILISLGNFKNINNQLQNRIKGESFGQGNYEIKDEQSKKQIKNYLQHINASCRVEYMWEPTLEKIKAWVEQNKPKDRLLFVQLGRIPKILFLDLLQKTKLPPIFEGQGTTNDVLNMGKPYLQPRKRRFEDNINYPSTILGYPITSSQGTLSIPNKIQEIANKINTQLYIESWPNEWDDNPAEIIGKFIKECRPDNNNETGKAYKEYFKKIEDFYGKAENDKFRFAISFLYYIIYLDQPKLAAETKLNLLDRNSEQNSSVLHALLVNLQRNRNADAVLRLIPGALDSGEIYNFFNSLLSSDLILTDSLITPTPATGDPTSIRVIGKALFLELPTVVDVVFTAPEGIIISDSKFTYTEEAWNPDELPWFSFKNPFVSFYIINAPTLITGSIGGTIEALDAELAIQLPIQNGKWQLLGDFETPLSLSKFYQLAGGVDLNQSLPSPFNNLSGFGVSNLQLIYDSNSNTIESIGFAFSTDQPCELVVGVVMENITANVTVYNPSSVANRTTTWSVSGTFKIGTGDQAGVVVISAFCPDVYLTGGLQSGEIKTVDLFNAFLNGAELNLPSSSPLPIITEFQFDYEVSKKKYFVTSNMNTHWYINILGKNILKIDQLGVAVAGQNGKFLGGLNGVVTILPEDPNADVRLFLYATYNTVNKYWTFQGKQTDGILSVSGLLKEYLDWDTELEIDIDGLDINIEASGTDGSGLSWEFEGKTAKPWQLPIDTGVSVTGTLALGYGNGNSSQASKKNLISLTKVPVLAANGKITSTPSLTTIDLESQKGLFGNIHADITWEKIELTVFYNFAPGSKSYGYGIVWDILSGKIVEQDGKTIATLNFTDSTTIGSIIELMVNWATGSKFDLGAPWNILNAIPINDLSLVYNFTDKQVSFNVNIGPIEMGFARIDAINVAYKSNQPKPEDNGVIVELTGQFRWQDDPNKPLGWDASKPETTPAPEGQGNKYLDLRLLALGQHVTLPCFATANTVQEAITCMKQLPKPDKDDIMIPPVTLDANSSWLIGMEFGILRFGGDKKQNGSGGESADSVALVSLTEDEAAPSGYFITMQIIFNDPNLYALRIALDGDAAKVLKGLDFQILYKKISDSIGLYKAEIPLPDKMRYITMGQYNITLPVFGIEYYTNGDFQVDFGFPWKADFSRSLTFQTLIWTPIGIPIPVMGSLGVYFGKLSSATTDKVPKISNGNFNPVLVFGFGIQFGLGYTFRVGILEAGFSLTAVAILEGVIAKFNAYQLTDGSNLSNQVDSSYYFWLQGTVGIIGKLFGTIDFAIIKADVNIDIRILTTFTFAPYEPIELNLMASVDVEVSVKIKLGLFKIKISFSFSAKISQTVTIKAIGNNPPWHVVQGEAAFFMASRRPRRRGLPNPQILLALAASTPLNWGNLKKAETPVKLQGYMTLGLTMAGDIATQLSEQIACYVAMMFIDSVAPPQEDPSSGMAKAYGTTTDTSFEVLAKTILCWAVAAIQPASVTAEEVDNLLITHLQLQRILDALNNPDQPAPIPSADIENFMTGQFNFQVEGPTSTKEPNATYFPVAPAMKLSLPNYGDDYEALSYTFGEYNKTANNYRQFLRHYFDQLAVKVQEENSNALEAFALNDSDGESLGSFIFSDYFLMIARQMLQSALDSLQEFKYFLQQGDTPNHIVQWINSNAELSGALAYSVEELFTDNVGVTLNADKVLKIQGATYVVQANDTFDSIAANSLFSHGFDGAALAMLNADTSNTLTAGIVIHYGQNNTYTTKPGQSLQTVAKAIRVEVAELIQNSDITALANLPLPVATYKVPEFTYHTAAGDTLRSVAAKFRIDQAQLAAPEANGEVGDLFDAASNPTLDIANLTQFKVGELLKEIQATQGLQHLSGMTSRYYMAGLRLPTTNGTTPGIIPQKKGMWVTGNQPSDYQLPDFAGLYALTGQQFPIPTLNGKDDFNVNFENGDLPWLNFMNEEDPETLQATLEISIKPNSSETEQITLVQKFATTTRLDTGLTTLGLQGMFNTKEATYTFNNEISWNAASAFNMPYGGQPPGIPAMQLWRLPDPLLALPDLSTRKVNPRMAIKVGEYSEAARAMVDRDLNYYGYASLIDFSIKRVPVIEASPSTQTTYEVIGADGNSAKVLERIVSEIGNNNNAIQTLILAYSTDANGTTSQGIQTDNADALTLGLAQVNLSTETRPDSGFMAELLLAESGAEGMTLLNEKTDFVRLLWEASITRAGGYFLYYFNRDNGGGLPDRIFNDKQEAQLSLIVVYSQPTDTMLQNTIGNYMNALVTGEAINRNQAVLYAESNPNPNFTIPSTTTQTLAAIAYEYFGNVSQVATDNGDLTLRSGLELVIPQGTYVVGPNAPGGNLQSIATYFGTTQQAIKDANPKIKTWPDPPAELDLYTALYLPELTIDVGTSPGGDTLGAIAKHYGVNLTALANHNQDVIGIFAEDQKVKISGGPVITTSTVPAGNVTLEAIRPEPPAIPDKPAGDNYGEIFLLNLYSLLSYQVTSNPYFTSSKLGLPANPTAEPKDKKNVSKLRVPKKLAEGDDWRFRLAVPYNQFSLQTFNAETNLPDPNKSPYKGLGDLLQVDFAWQDLYGNCLITNLSHPTSGDKTPLNQSPILTGYNDVLIGLKQWPSVVSTYEIVEANGVPTIQLFLNFDPSVYQGLLSAIVKSDTTIDAVFTEAIDPTSATTQGNYTLDNNITVRYVDLGADNRTVTLTVDQLPTGEEITLSVTNISNLNKTQTFQGLAKFYNPETSGESTSTLLQKAKGDLQTYTQLWYQLNDPYGIAYKVITSLVTKDYRLDSTQVSHLVEDWLASIWQFVSDRAHRGTSISPPATSHILSFPIEKDNLNPSKTYKLDLIFTIERTGGAVMGDLETTGGVKSVSTEISPSVSTEISPYAGAADQQGSSLKTFAQNFETALKEPGRYSLTIATGIDREESLFGKSGNELWVVRLGFDQQTSIAYQINDRNAPLLFAPRPISTSLESRSQVPIWDFNPSTGINFDGDPSRRLDFTSIDLDLWAQQIFSAIDNTLSPEFTAAIQLVDHNKNATYLQTLLDNKKKLANIIKNWMILVLEGESGSTAEIQEAFYQQLLVRLSNAYTVKAGVQYSAKVEAGEFKLHFVSLDEEKNLVLLFTSDIDQATAENVNNYQISDGLTVSSATLNAQNPQLVTLKLREGAPVIGKTQVTIASSYQDAQGTSITGALTIVLQSGTTATPKLYGNINQNFKFLGAAIDKNNKAQLYLYFSGTLYKGTGQEPNSALNVQNYSISGFTVNAAALDSSNSVVVLTLSGKAVVGQTKVTVAQTLTTITAQKLLPPLTQTVEADVDVSHQTRNITITSAKLNLKNSDAVPLSFLISAPQLVRNDEGAVLSYIDLDTTYEGSDIEQQIGTLPNISDYRASSWLSFLNETNTLNGDLGMTKVPLILRSFPASPAMVNQQGEATNPLSGNDISKILEWNYMINYSQTVHYPQDELNFTVNFNVKDEPIVLESFEDAFAPMAEFITIYPSVEKVFRETLIQIDATTTEQNQFDAAAIALESFNAMVDRIITLPEGNGFPMANLNAVRQSNAIKPYKFRLKEGSGTIGAENAALVITIFGKPSAGIGNPKVTIPDYTTETYTENCNGDFCFYFKDAKGNPLKASIGQGIAPRAVELPSMNILARQDAETKVELKRNVALVPDKQTVSDFIYSTGQVSFANPYHPLISYDQMLPIATTEATLIQHLTDLFNKLLKENSQETLSFLMTNTYTYQSNSALNPIELPIMMQPMQSFNVQGQSADNGDKKTLTEMIESWSGSIKKWFSDHKTSRLGGILYFDLTIFSNLTQQPMPLLRLNSLSLELKYVIDI